MYAEIAEILFQRCDRDIDEMAQQSAITLATGLEFGRCGTRDFETGRVCLGLTRCLRVEPGQVFDIDRRFGRIIAVEIRVVIDEVRLLFLQLGDQMPHLQAPIAQMDVRHDRIPAETENTLETVAQNRGAQVADMHRLGHIGSTEIDHHRFRRLDRRCSGALISSDLGRACVIGRGRRGQVYETGTGNLGIGQEVTAGDLFKHGLRDIARRLSGLFGRRHGAIALIGGQFRVLLGRSHTAKFPRKLKGDKRVAQQIAELIGN